MGLPLAENGIFPSYSKLFALRAGLTILTLHARYFGTPLSFFPGSATAPLKNKAAISILSTAIDEVHLLLEVYN